MNEIGICLLCGNVLNNEINFAKLFKSPKLLLCDDCRLGLEPVKGGCVRCGKKTKDTICDDCLYWEKITLTKDIVITNYSLYYSNNLARLFMRKLKFLGDAFLISAFKPEIRAFFKNITSKKTYLVPVPIHPDRLFERGFNQSLWICKIAGLPILDFIKKNNNEKQSKKKKEERIILDNQYYVEENPDLTGSNIIIVDDIYTTGATVHKIALLLHASCNAKNIISFTLFRS